MSCGTGAGHPVLARRLPDRAAPNRRSGGDGARKFGPAALQPDRPGSSTVTNQSEDCLFLNVWTRATDGHRPVIVWIHGGAFVGGTGADPRCDGTRYVEQGCVVVTVNYRLGAFGCLHQVDRPGSGNARLLDQIAALRWVRENIAEFGGDPHNVTVMGESAGGMSVGPLLGALAARGLFHRAVPQSGGPRPVRTPDLAAQTTKAVVRTLGLRDSRQLAAVPAADLLDASTQAKNNSHLLEPFPHVIDGTVLPLHSLRLVDGRVDLLIGTWDKEADTFSSSPLDERRFEQQAHEAAGDEIWQRLKRV